MIGTYIKETVLPKDITIKNASIKLGVSRVTLSRVINGKTNLSFSLAKKIEKAFGFSADELIKMQDKSLGTKKRQPHLAYTPRVYKITTKHIEQWLNSETIQNIGARTTFAVLIRKLIMSHKPLVQFAFCPILLHSQISLIYLSESFYN